MMVIGLLQIAIMTGASTLALTMIEASRTVLIAYSMPIWGMLLSFVILGERVTRPMLGGIVLGFAGLALLCAPLVDGLDERKRAPRLGTGAWRNIGLGACLGSLPDAPLEVGFLVSDLSTAPGGRGGPCPCGVLAGAATGHLSTTLGAVLVWNAIVQLSTAGRGRSTGWRCRGQVSSS